MYYLNLDENKNCDGFYVEDIHGVDKCNFIISHGGLKIDEELWGYLLTLNMFKFIGDIGDIEDRVYIIEDKELFEKIITQEDISTKEPNLSERLEALELLVKGVI